ncbi:MAG: amino acid adenylation domain-containing protein [Bacteroidales bacterium]|nr:amino acid adenylation domain-containing protein [Bacteroidales bacterium]
MQKSVIEYLERTVSLFPNKEAVHDSEMSITFSELWKTAEHISNAIYSEGIEKNSPIGVFIPKGCKMIESFAGINMCGCFYVPLDTKSPNSRVSSILTTLEANCVITDKAHKEQLVNFYKGKVLVVEDIISNSSFMGGGKNDALQIDTDPVYSIFTSGSTGTPKGVVVAHRGVIDYIDWAVSTFNITSDSVIGNQAPFYFDNSTLDIYLMYATGATLNIIPESCFAFPAKLVDYLNEHKITFVFWVPFVLVNVANMNILASKKPEYLKDVFFAGEVMPNKHLNYWKKYLPDCRYVNLYGPTEITVDCTYYVVERNFTDDEPLPIGFPCRNSNVLILVDRQRLAKQGEQGELCVRGSSLALGYYNNEEKTTDAFIQNPLHNHYPETIYCTGDMVYENEKGEIMYVGRIDAQIKHNGYRIELGEIETAILGTNMVDSCCVVYDFTNKKIVLFYQATEDLNMAEFRKILSTKIPRYMLPTEYHREEILKQNNNGKIDRNYYNKYIKEL